MIENKDTHNPDKKVNKKKKTGVISRLFPFILGGLFTYYILTPAIDGKFNYIFKTRFNKESDSRHSRNKIFFNQIDEKISQYKLILFKNYFGSNSSSAYNEYNELNNYSNQLNPNNDSYWQSRGYDKRPDDWENRIKNELNQTQDNWDNYANQLNPNNDAYWQGHGYDERPANWQNQPDNSSNSNLDNHANQMNPNNDAYQGKK